MVSCLGNSVCRIIVRWDQVEWTFRRTKISFQTRWAVGFGRLFPGLHCGYWKASQSADREWQLESESKCWSRIEILVNQSVTVTSSEQNSHQYANSTNLATGENFLGSNGQTSAPQSNMQEKNKEEIKPLRIYPNPVFSESQIPLCCSCSIQFILILIFQFQSPHDYTSNTL